MNVRRNGIAFLAMLLIALCVTALAAEAPLTRTWNALQGRPDGCDWQCVGTGSGTTAAAAGWENGALVLRWFTTEGKSLSQRRMTLPAEAAGGTVVRLLPVRENLTYVGLYSPNAEKLLLYRVGDGEPTCLLSRDCPGNTCAERTARTKFTELLYENEALTFALWTDQKLEGYLATESGGLEALGMRKTAEKEADSILVFPDGTLLQGGGSLLRMNAKRADRLAAGQTVTRLTQGKGGWYYFNETMMELCFVDADLRGVTRIFPLSTTWKGEDRTLTSMALTRDERVLALLDGTTLTLTDADGSRELSGVLRPAALGLWLELAKYAAIALAAALLLWLPLCGLRRGYASLAVLRGSLFVTAVLLCLASLRFAVLLPAAQRAAEREYGAAVTAALRAADVSGRWDDDTLEADAARLLEGTGCGTNVRVVRAEQTDVWRCKDGRNAAALAAFDSELAEQAVQEGTVFQFRNGVFRCALAEGKHCLSIRMECPALPEDRQLYTLLLAGFGALILLTLGILFRLGANVRKISKRMERVSQGVVPERLTLRTGDELESMASIVNALGETLRTQETDRERWERAYRRFVPEKVLTLLGRSVQDVDKTAFAARNMVVMTVRFAFPDELYTDIRQSRLLFDSVNEVIARTSAIAARKGGTVFHIAYNSFDLVMDDAGEALSTAVAIQQEVLSFSEARVHEGLPGVTLHIALDRGSFLLGIVGDDSMMAPTTISSSLSVVQELIDLSGRLKAGILCTEAIMAQHQDYGSRYMGKCVVGKQPVRVYEVFDGDEFNTRRGKLSSLEEFSQGVYDLYSGETVRAKRTFLQLAHSYPLDGGVRWYLHLADRLEHDPTLPCVLNVDRTDGGEM